MLSTKLADFITSLRYEELPPSVQELVLLCILDWYGSALRGSLEPPARMVSEIITAEGGYPHASLIGFRKKGSSLWAALINGVSSHTLELDDLHRASILHPAAPIIPAAIAAAEKAGVSGKTLLEGIVAGYETAIRIGEAVNPSHYYYWHTTGTCGTFGAAAAAAKILGLSQEAVVSALGSAGTQAAGLWEFHQDAAMSKHLHAGKAAANGLLAAYLAEKGFTAATRILDGEKGFFNAFAADYDPAKVTIALGEDFRMLQNSFKLHSSCRHTHGGVDLILELKQEGVKPHQIKEICYQTYKEAVGLVANKTPANPFQARFSLPYCGGAALLFGKLGLGEFTGENLQNPLLLKLMELSRVEASDWADQVYPGQWSTRLLCRLEDGTLMQRQTENPRGDPENPLGKEELESKYLDMVSACIPEKEALLMLAKISNLANIASVNDLFAEKGGA
jgi:2-methylcitrate dehydratase PrpD